MHLFTTHLGWFTISYSTPSLGNPKRNHEDWNRLGLVWGWLNKYLADWVHLVFYSVNPSSWANTESVLLKGPFILMENLKQLVKELSATRWPSKKCFPFRRNSHQNSFPTAIYRNDQMSWKRRVYLFWLSNNMGDLPLTKYR